jgi:AcrR family transcriptional regulator
MSSRRPNAKSKHEPRRTGRRPGPSKTREQILDAARTSFAKHGYDRTSVRSVAADAGVDPALVRRFYGSKEGLLAAALKDALAPDDRLAEALEGDLNALGDRMIAYFLGVWEEPRNRQVLVAMLRSACTNDRGAKMLRNYLTTPILTQLAGVLDPADAELRANLIASNCIGLAFSRYVLKLEPLASASAEEVRIMYGPNFQRFLTGNLDLVSARPGKSRRRGR